MPESSDPTATGKLDLSGAALAAIGLGGSTYALIEAPEGMSAAVVATAVIGIGALIGFFVQEARTPNPMLPLTIFRSRQFSAANGVTFVVYAALGVVFFLLVSFLQISLGYTPVEAGASTLPITALMLVGSARAGALAQRIGPRIPLTVGPLIITVGLLLMLRINPGDSYVGYVLPAVFVFGLGLTFVVAPVTATVLAAVDSSHAGIASGVNNAVARVAGLLAVAVIPVIAGLTGDKFYEPSHMTHGFHVGMVVCAILAAFGAVVAWTTISSDVLEEEGEEPEECDYSCGIGAPALRPAREPSHLSEPSPAPPG